MTLIPERSPTDIAFGVARVILGGQAYHLPALAWRAADEWEAAMYGETRAFITALEDAGDDTTAILARLRSEPERLLDALMAYDTTGVLPSRDVILDTASKSEVLVALLGVWRAANPLVDAGIEAMGTDLTSSLLFALLSTQPVPTAGPPDTSESTRPRNGSSPTSTSGRSATKTSSTRPSKPRGSATSSRATTRRTNGGAAAPRPSTAALAPSTTQPSRQPS